MLPTIPVDLQLQSFCVQLCKDDIISDDFQNENNHINTWDTPLHKYESLEQDILEFSKKELQVFNSLDIILKREDVKQEEEDVKQEEEDVKQEEEDDSLICREENLRSSASSRTRLIKRQLFRKLTRKLRRAQQFSSYEEEFNSVSTHLDIEISIDPCNCAKTGCQKMYCECLAKGKLCSDGCHCRGCKNKEPNELLFRAIRSINSGKHDSHSAHRERFRSQRYRDGCTCKKSQCLKKYCECYANGRRCGPGCMCEECMNIDEDVQQSDSESKNQVVHTRSQCKSTTIKQKNENFKCVKVTKFDTESQSINPNSSSQTSFKFTLGGMVENTLNCRLLTQFYLNAEK